MFASNLKNIKSGFVPGLAVAAIAVVLTGCATIDNRGGSNPAVGTWATIVEAPTGPTPMTLTINADLSGTVSMTEPEEASFAIADVMVDGQSLSFSMVFQIQGQELPAKFQGTIDGDAITGEFATDFGNAAVTGTRQ